MNAVAEIAKDAAYWTEQALLTWANTMRGIDGPEGLPSEACGGMENYTTLDVDNERAYGKLDAWIAEVTGAVVEGLPDTMRNVVKHAYGLLPHVEVWRYNSVLTLARLEVQAGLRRRGVWLGE